MRRVRPFVPPGAHVVAVAEAHANPVDELHRATPVVLTEYGLLLVTSTGFTGVTTYVPFLRVSEAHAEGTKLFVSFRDEHDRPRTFDADFGRKGGHVVEQFLQGCRDAQPGLKSQDEAPVASYHVAWDGDRGATFDVFDHDGKKVVRSTYDDGVSGVQASEMCKQATMDVTRAIADRPELVWVREKPGWMPEFVWNPPLPETPPQVDRRREPRPES